MTVKQAIELVLWEVEAEQSKLSRHTYTWHAKNAAKIWGDSTPLDLITRKRVQTWVNERRKQVQPATLRHELSFLNRLFRVWQEAGGGERPTDLLRLPKINNWRKQTLTPEMDSALRSIMTPVQWSLVEFAVQTGLRRLEQWSLKSSEVRIWSTGEQLQPTTGIMVPLFLGMIDVATSKTGKGRSVPLNHRAAAVARWWLARKSEYLFAPENPNRHAAAEWFSDRVWRPALDRVGIKDLRWHDLRHTFATRALHGGARPESISKTMGHSNLGMTERYMHWDEDLLWPAVMAVNTPPRKKRR